MERSLFFKYTFISRINTLLGNRYFIPACVLTAVIIRLTWALLINPTPVSDPAWYYERAQEMARGNGYSIDGIPTAYWPVGYPIFLAGVVYAFGSSLLVLKLTNVLLTIPILLLSYLIARKTFDERVGRITLLILAFYPNYVSYTSLLFSETFFTFLLLAAVGALFLFLQVAGTREKLLALAVAGAFFGFACLVKPLIILLPLLLLPLLMLRRQPDSRPIKQFIVCTIIVYAVIFLVLAPLAFRNYDLYHDVIFISNNAGINLYIGNNPDATGQYMFTGPMLGIFNASGNEHMNDVIARNYAISYIVHNPMKTIELLPVKFWSLYATDIEGTTWNIYGIAGASWFNLHFITSSAINALLFSMVVLSQFYYILLLILFACYTCYNFRRFKSLNMVGYCLIVYFTLIYLATFGDPRFHFPVMPWIVMYAAAMLQSLFAKYDRKMPG